MDRVAESDWKLLQISYRRGVLSLQFGHAQRGQRIDCRILGLTSRRHKVGDFQVTQASMPAGLRRVPTGAVQFGEDWPGLFIRGDDAVALMLSIRQLEKHIGGAANRIESFAVDRVCRIADLIERDVIVRRSDP
jgi:hypothetical protein